MAKPKTVFRTDGKNRSYTNIANTLLQDQTIGWDVRGMLCDLLSRPNDWEISAAGLIAMTRIGGKPSVGKALVWRLIKDALNAGYMAKTVERRKDGTISAFIYIVSDDPAFLREQAGYEPHTENRCIETACQHTENQCTAEPCIAETTQQTIDENKPPMKEKTKNLKSVKSLGCGCKKYTSVPSEGAAATEEEDFREFAMDMKRLDENRLLAGGVLFSSTNADGYPKLGELMDKFGAPVFEQAVREVLAREKRDGKMRRGGIRTWSYFSGQAADIAKKIASGGMASVEECPW